MRDGTDEDHCKKHGAVGQGVEQVRGGLAQVGDQQSAERGTYDCAGLEGDRLDAERARQIPGRNQVRDEGLTGRQVKGGSHRLQRGQSIDMPEGDPIGEGQDPEDNRDCGHRSRA